jgi:hypothetical protein
VPIDQAPADEAVPAGEEGETFMQKHGGKVVMGILAAAIVGFALLPQRGK